jgi:hypothetical protein
MKKIIYLTFAIIGLGATMAQAQEKPSYGIRAGANFADWRGELYSGFGDLLESTGGLKSEGRTGFHAGAYVQLPLSERFILEPGLYYSTKGVRVSQHFLDDTMVGGLLNVKASVANESHYIDMPVYGRFYLTEGLHIYGGPQISYLLKNKVRMEAGALGFSLGHAIDVDPGLREWDFALSAGIGYEFSNGLNFTAGYDHGLTTLDEGRGDFEAYNKAVKVSVGFTF